MYSYSFWIQETATLEACMRFSWSFFVKKLCFSVFVLNSIKEKDSRFISGVQFYLMVPVSFPDFQLEEQCFHITEISYFVLIGSYEIFEGPTLDIVFFVLFFMNWFDYKHFRSYLDEDSHLILLLSFVVSICVLNSRSRHLAFLGVRSTFQVFF